VIHRICGDEAKIADYLGMTLEMLRRVYGHHHPDYQHDAVQAITAKPSKPRFARLM
jgi:hypothetical protein